MSLLKDVIASGTHADRPIAGNEGRLYYETDTGGLFRDNGSAWEPLTPFIGPVEIVNTDPAVPTLITKSASGQSAAMQEWQRDDSTPLVSFTYGGTIIAEAALHRIAGVVSAYHTVCPWTIRGASGQDHDITQWQDDATNVIARCDQSGALVPQNGARLTSGIGAPVTPGGVNPTAGDVYFRTDTPSIANQSIYICTVGGATPTWVGIA